MTTHLPPLPSSILSSAFCFAGRPRNRTGPVPNQHTNSTTAPGPFLETKYPTHHLGVLWILTDFLFQVLPWMDFYAEQGLVDGQHLQVWEKAGASLGEAFLSQEEERQLRELQDKVRVQKDERTARRAREREREHFLQTKKHPAVSKRFCSLRL